MVEWSWRESKLCFRYWDAASDSWSKWMPLINYLAAQLKNQQAPTTFD